MCFSMIMIPNILLSSWGKYLEEKEVKVLAWSSQSPYLNPIEHIWVHMKRELSGKNFNDPDELKAELLRLWNSLPENFIKKLIKSMPKCVKEVSKSRGKYSSY